MNGFMRFVIAVILAVSFYGSVYAKLPEKLIDKLILQQTLQAEKIKDMAKVETMENSAAGAGEIEITSYRKGDKTRQETKMTFMGSSRTTLLISDGTTKWQIANNLKARQGDAVSRAEAIKKYSKELINNENNMNVSRAETFNGNDCYVVETSTTDRAGNTSNGLMWIDKNSGLTYQMIFFDASGGERVKTVMSDFRDVADGVKMPFMTELYSYGQLKITTRVKSIKANKGLDDSLFDVSGYKEFTVNSSSQAVTGNNTVNQNSVGINSGAATGSGDTQKAAKTIAR